MIEARNSKVVVLRQLQAGQIALSVEAVARCGRQVVGQRHEVVPKLADQRVDTDSPGIAGLAGVARRWTDSRLDGCTRYRIYDRQWVEVINLVDYAGNGVLP